MIDGVRRRAQVTERCANAAVHTFGRAPDFDGVGTVLVLGAVGLVCTALTEAPGWPASRTWMVLAAGLALGAAFVAHIRRHPDPLVAPRLFWCARSVPVLPRSPGLPPAGG